MLRTLAWKEFRELLPLVVVVLLVQAFLICVGLGVELEFVSQSIRYYIRPPDTIPFIGDQLCFCMMMISGVAAVTIALWQTMWESGRGTFQFLLHRPVTRTKVIGAKLLVGGVVSTLLMALPVSYYALWAATPGTHASPFAWSMTSDTWRSCAAIPLIFLGAFFSGLRPALWYGSRFLPLIAAWFAVGLIDALAAQEKLAMPTVAWLISLGGIGVACGIFVFGILRTASTSDFS